ncbi:hypothetical protein JZU57_02720, partial [bacterium]|nr:hypothetical protein [bacterium]
MAHQTSTVTFGAAQTVAADQWNSVMVNGHDYAVAVGDNASIWVNTSQTVTALVEEWGTAISVAGIVPSAANVVLGNASVTPSTLSATAMSLNLGSGAAVVGDVYTLTIAGKAFTVTASDTTTDALATALRNEITKDTAYTAGGAGSIVTVARKDNTVVGTTTFQSGPNDVANALITPTTNLVTLELSGMTVVNGDIYTVTIASQAFTVTASSSNINTLASALRAAIDGDAAYVVGGTGSNITVVRQDSAEVGATTFQTGPNNVTTAVITPSTDTSQPLKIDEAGWTPATGAKYTITIGGTDFLVMAASGETDVSLAGKLKTAIDANATYAATLSGNTISVTLQAGGRVTATTTTAQTPPDRTLNLSALSVVSGVRYTVTVGSVSVTVRASSSSLSAFVTDLTDALDKDAGLIATASGNIITLTDADPASGVNPLTDTITSSAKSLQPVAESGRAAITARSQGGQRINLTGLPVRNDVQYTITIGGTDYAVTTSGDTLSTLTGKLVAAIGATASSTLATVVSTWSSVNATLDTLVEKGEAVTVQQARPVNLSGVKADTAATYTLNIGTDNVSLTADAGMS